MKFTLWYRVNKDSEWLMQYRNCSIRDIEANVKWILDELGFEFKVTREEDTNND